MNLYLNRLTTSFREMSIGDFLVCLVVLLFPISIKFSSIAISLLVVYCLVTTTKTEFFDLLKKNWVPILIHVSPFFLIVLSLFYSDFYKLGFKSLEKYVALLLFPLIFCVPKFQSSYKFVFPTFLFTISLMAVTCMGNGIYNFFTNNYDSRLVGDYINGQQGPLNSLTNQNLMRPFNINPIYMSFYVTFAIGILLSKDILKTYAKYSLIFLLFVFEILIGSRIGIVTAIIVLGLFILISIKKKRDFRVFILGGFISVVIFSLIVYTNPLLKRRYIDEFISISASPSDITQWNGINMRIAIWKCSWNAFVNSPILGFGLGSQESQRNPCYESYSFNKVFGSGFNSHNQYLEFGLIGGLILLSAFLLQLILSFCRAYTNANATYYIFLIIIVLICFAESILEVNKGIVFFGFFNSLFFFRDHSNKYLSNQ